MKIKFVLVIGILFLFSCSPKLCEYQKVGYWADLHRGDTIIQIDYVPVEIQKGDSLFLYNSIKIVPLPHFKEFPIFY